MRWIVSSSIRFRTLVVAAAAMLFGAGAWQLRMVPLDVVPEFSPPSLVVKTEALGLSSTEVEALITVPLEADLLNGVPWLRTIQSDSMAGVSTIEMSFTPGTDLMRARQMVQERLSQAPVALPNVSSPPILLQPVSSASRVMSIGLSSSAVPLIEMTVQAHWTVVPRLAGVPGVANVSVWGRRDRQVQVQVDPETLHQHGITLEQVVKTAGEAVFASPLTFLNSSTPGTGGFIDTPNQRLNIRHLSPITTPQAFARLPIVESPVTLEQVARVVESHQPLIGDAIVKDGPGLLLVVEKFPGYNTQEVTRGIEAALQELRPGLTGIEVDSTVFRPAGYIERATDNLVSAVLAGGALLLVSLLVLLRGWRAALIAAIAVLLSFVVAGLTLRQLGVAINTMAVAGLLMAIGVVVHDAVAQADAIAGRPRANGGGLGGSVLPAVLEVQRSTLPATVILLLLVAPVLLTQGSGASLFKPLAWSYVVAVIASALVALTVTPALAVLLLPARAPAVAERSAPAAADRASGLERLHPPFERMAAAATGSLLPSLGLAAAASLLLAYVWSRSDRQLVPELKETDVVVAWQAPPGTALPAMTQVTSSLVADLRAIPGVRNAAAQIGRAVLCNCDEMVDVNSAEVWVSIDPAADRSRTLAALRTAIADYPGMRGEVNAYLSASMRKALTETAEGITVRLYGQDLAVLRGKAEEVRGALAQINGIRSTRIEQQPEETTIEVEADLDRAAAHGLKPGDIRRAVSTLVGGIRVGALFEQQKVFDVVVWGAPEMRDSVGAIGAIMLDTEEGAQVRLSDVAQVRLVPATSVIRRQGVARRMDVEAEVGGRPIAAVARDVAERVKAIPFPFEYRAQVLGGQPEPRAALRSAGAYLVAAAVLGFLVLQATLGSWHLAALSLLGVPIALLGVALAVYLDGGVVSLGALLGCGVVLGLTLQGGIMMVRHLQALERDGTEPSGEPLVRRGMRERLAPTLAPLVATGALILPFVLFGEVAGLEVAHPMGIAVLGGLVSSALVTLVLTPALYLRFGAGSATDSLGLEGAEAR
jgi:Cu/Ag efflux pump CusA